MHPYTSVPIVMVGLQLTTFSQVSMDGCEPFLAIFMYAPVHHKPIPVDINLTVQQTLSKLTYRHETTSYWTCQSASPLSLSKYINRLVSSKSWSPNPQAQYSSAGWSLHVDNWIQRHTVIQSLGNMDLCQDLFRGEWDVFINRGLVERVTECKGSLTLSPS